MLDILLKPQDLLILETDDFYLCSERISCSEYYAGTDCASHARGSIPSVLNCLISALVNVTYVLESAKCAGILPKSLLWCESAVQGACP